MDSCNQTETRFFDQVRKNWVAAKGEERVRQWLLSQMLGKWGYPSELVAVEKEIQEFQLPRAHLAPKRRVDLLCFHYAKELLSPLLLVECKENLIEKEALSQALAYNSFIQAPFIAIIGKRKKDLIAFWGASHKGLETPLHAGFPTYQELKALCS